MNSPLKIVVKLFEALEKRVSGIVIGRAISTWLRHWPDRQIWIYWLTKAGYLL